MKMEGSSGIQRQLSQPPPAEDADEVALALTKRARKRSRYLSPPYTDTHVQEKEAAGSHKKQQQGLPLPHVSSAEMLTDLRAAALGQGQGQGQEQVQVMDAAALRFLSMYRNSIFVDDHPDSHATAGGGSQDDGIPLSASAADVAGVGYTMLNLNAGPDHGSLAKKKNKEKKNHHLHPPPVQNAASQSAGFAATATHGHCASNPPVPVAPPKKRNRKRKKMKSLGHKHNYLGDPVALVLDFAEGTPLPSKEDLLSTFRRFGSVIDSETIITQDKHTVRVAFATRAQAETAFSCAATLGAFGPPFAVPSLQDLPHITLNTPTPLPKLPLMEIRSNLEKMIFSLSFKATATATTTTASANSPQEAKKAVNNHNLVGEMQHLLAKVDKELQVQAASATAHHA